MQEYPAADSLIRSPFRGMITSYNKEVQARRGTAEQDPPHSMAVNSAPLEDGDSIDVRAPTVQVHELS